MEFTLALLAPAIRLVRRLFAQKPGNVTRAGDGGSISIYANRSYPLTEAGLAILQTMYEWMRTLLDHHGDPQAQAEALQTFEAISVTPRR